MGEGTFHGQSFCRHCFPLSLKKRSERTSRLPSAAIGFRLDSGVSSTDSSGSQKLDGFPLESVDAFPWNHWMTSIGISGCFRLESVDDLPRKYAVHNVIAKNQSIYLKSGHLWT